MSRTRVQTLPPFPVGLVVGAALVSAFGAVGAAIGEKTGQPARAAVTSPHEDSPEFSCLLHGNARCGDPYQTCLAAANRPHDGFAVEVCDPLAEGATFVPTGEFTYYVDGGMVTLPPLAESIADSCGDADLRECVAALIRERQEVVR